jgi:DNA-binding transcriptional LysR family regulator
VDWASLNAFVAVADHGGFSAAAAQLHLTQPAVSKRIALLEASLGARLFDRLGRQVLLTEAGRLLLPRAKQMLAEADAARRAIDDLDQDIGGRLSLATSHHIGLHRLPHLLRRFSALHPRVALDLGFMDSEQAYARVLQGSAELALTTLGPTQPPLRSTPLWDDPLHVVVAPDHPLAMRTKVSLADLAAHPAVLPDAVTFTHRIVAEAFARRGLALQLRMTTNYLETIKMLAAVGLAWTVLPQTMLDAQVRVLPVTGLKLTRQLGYTIHGGRTLSRAAQAFIDLLKADASPG